MDSITHGLSGMLLGRVLHKTQQPAGLTLRARFLVGFLCAIFPDIDFVMRAGGMLTYLNTHRGVTHSILLAPIWAWLLAWLFAWLWRGRYSWRAFYLLCLLSILAHIIGDLITAYGTMLFAPLSNGKLSWSTTFIIDLYFTAIIALTLIVAAMTKRHGRQIAIAGALLLISYIGFQGFLQHAAVRLAYDRIAQQQLRHATAEAIPQPLSPFNWKLIISDQDSYQVAYVNLWREEVITVTADANWLGKLNALYAPKRALVWQAIPRFGGDEPQQALSKHIWQSEAMRDIRGFMLYPSTFFANDSGCAWFVDQRFVLSNMRQPFVFGGCQEEVNAIIRLYRWDEAGKQLIQ